MKFLVTFKDNKSLYLDEYCNLHIVEENVSYPIKFLDDSIYSRKAKFISFREIMFKIFNRDEFSKARNTRKKYKIFLGSTNELAHYYFNYSINNEVLYISIYCRLSMEEFILVDTEISNFLLSDYSMFLNDLEKYLLSLKNIKIYKSSNKSLFYNNEVCKFHNNYYLNFNKNTYSLDYSIHVLSLISKVMNNLNNKLIFNNKKFESFGNYCFNVNLKREKNNEAFGEFHIYNINLNLVKKSFKGNDILIELVYVHEYAHALDRCYFNSSLKKNRGVKESRDKLILDIIKSDSSILKSLLYSRNYKNSESEETVKKFLCDLDNLDSFYESVYYKRLGDYAKYYLKSEEILARIFEIYYLNNFYEANYDEYSKNVFYLMDRSSIIHLERFLKNNKFTVV